MHDDMQSDWCELIKTLQKMEAFGEIEYKKALHRLFLMWHTDRCQKPYASQFFQVLRNHEASYRRDKNFSWFDASVSVEDAMMHKNDDWEEEYGGGGLNSWFAEFHREQKQEEEAVLRQQHAQPAGFSAKTQPVGEHREFNRDSQVLGVGDVFVCRDGEQLQARASQIRNGNLARAAGV